MLDFMNKSLNGRGLFLIPLLVYGFVALLYLLAVPIGESPDEPGHLQCIEQVSIQGRLPQIDPQPDWGSAWWSRGIVISGRMCYHMPLYYVMAGGVQRVVANLFAEPIDYEFPPTNQNFGPNLSLFDHTVKPSFWVFSGPMHLLALRLFSVFLGGIVVWGSVAVARRLLPKQPSVALGAGLLTAVWPQFVYLSRSFNNDSLATAISVILLVLLLQTQQPKRFVWAGLLAILAIFTKISVAFTIVAVLLVWGLEYWHYPRLRKQYWRYLFVCLTIYGVGFLALYFIPPLWEHISQTSGSFSSRNQAALQWTYWQDVLELTASSGWARFGWMNVAAPQWHAIVWWVFLLATAVLGFIMLFRKNSHLKSRLNLTIIIIWLGLVAASYVQINLNRFQPQFRFALASIPVLTTLSALGWWWLVGKNGRLYRISTVVVAVSLVLYNVWIIVTVIDQAYQWW